ncbi:hypothetical protein IW138_002805 [Coemansia sp. RSA 986]|nr:hypothetical protein IW138_002805 [Coemansia sp. RSA 986]
MSPNPTSTEEVPRRKRGRPRKDPSDIELANGSESEYSDKNNDSEPIEPPPVRIGAKRGRKPKRAAIQRKVSTLTKTQEKRRCIWSGPPDLLDLGRKDPLPTRSTNCIDLATDEAVWNTLRETQPAVADIDLEPNALKVREYIGGINFAEADKSTEAAAPLSLVLSDKSPEYQGSDNTGEIVEIDPLCAAHRFETPGNRGWIANVKQSVLSIDWAPQRHQQGPRDTGTINTDYIAVGGLGVGSEGTDSMSQLYLERDKHPKPGAIQIWAVHTDPMTKQATKEESCKLDMLLLHTFGRCLMLKWCPISIPQSETETGNVKLIGYLAAIFGDGYLRVCAVPHPHFLRKDTSPSSIAVSMYWPREKSLLQVRAPRGIFTSIDWACADLVVACTSKGAITVWPLGPCVTDGSPHKEKDTNVYPILNQTAHSGPISLVNAISVAYLSPLSNRQAEFTKISVANVQIFTTGSDGRLYRTLLGLQSRQRHPLMRFPGRMYSGAVFWPTRSFLLPDINNSARIFNESVLTQLTDPVGVSLLDHYSYDPDADVVSVKRRADQNVLPWNSDLDLHIVNCYHFDSTLLQMASSEFHSFVAMVSANGQVVLQNAEYSRFTRRGSIFHRIVYELAWDHEAERLVCYRGWCFCNLPVKKGMAGEFGIFPVQVAVQACAWSRNPLSSAWMASAGANGLLRIENVSRLPYI